MKKGIRKGRKKEGKRKTGRNTIKYILHGEYKNVPVKD
jgi:hypothetical protein